RLRRLLDTAEQVLASEGAEALTTTRVAEAAGVSVGSLYQYLPDKGAIVQALARRYLADFEGLMGELERDAGRGGKGWDDPVGVRVPQRRHEHGGALAALEAAARAGAAGRIAQRELPTRESEALRRAGDRLRVRPLERAESGRHDVRSARRLRRVNHHGLLG